MNTYGLNSINYTTFNGYTDTRRSYSCTYPESDRNLVVTFLKVHNLTLNILGYLPGISAFSGCVRIGTGCGLCIVTVLYGDPKAKQGPIVGHFYSEAVLTGITQIARGILEAFCPFGWILNASLDTLGTINNYMKTKMICWHCFGREYINHDPTYSFPFNILDLA